MSLYTVLLFVHLTGLSVFLAGHGVSIAAALGLRRQPGKAEGRLLLDLSVKTMPVTYGALLVVIGSGVWMGFLGHWWGHAWIWVGLAVLLVVVAVMGFLAEPYRKARGAETEESFSAAAGEARPLTLTWLGALGWTALIFLMVFKPF